MAESKSEFRNDSGMVAGYTYYDQEDKARGGACPPGDTVWLSEKDRVATANAPKSRANNPFENGVFTLVTAATAVALRRPIGPDEVPQPPEATPADEERKAAEEPAPESEAKPEPEEPKPTNAQVAAQRAVRPKGGADLRPKPSEKESATTPQEPAAPAQGKRAAGEEVATPPATSG